MDTETISLLKDYDKNINELLSNLDNKFNKIKDKSDKDLSQIKNLLKNIETNLGVMEGQILLLKEEFNKTSWTKKRKDLLSKYKDLNGKFVNLKNQEKEENTDPENIDRPFDHNKATVIEEYKRGKKILAEDNRILGELIDIVSKDGETLVVVKQKLKEQRNQLEMLPFEEMEFSLKRAGTKIKKMMKMALKDRIAKCLIAVISIIILTIIIVSLCKDKKDNNYNLPLDIFSSNKNGINNNNDTSSYEYSFCLVNKFYYTILIIILLLI